MPQFVDGEFQPRLMMPLSITYDHRIVDGAAAARFLNDVKGYLANPGRLLLAPPVTLAVAAGVMLLARLDGSTAGFGAALAVTVHASVVLALQQLVATPLLYYNMLAQEAGREVDPRIRRRVQEAATQLLDRQAPDGSFGLWSAGDGHASPWLGAYIVDFLQRAQRAGYAIPRQPMNQAYNALRRVARHTRARDAAAAERRGEHGIARAAAPDVVTRDVGQHEDLVARQS